ncbi:MAG TPA: SMI1/KNR4 family protein [Gemmataceae bacterium]|nr:SMI1/KNR4 family protein [Gemmataceae bacterium]
MGKWRNAFEHGRPSKGDSKYGVEYTFGPPATKEQLAAVEAALGVKLPADVSQLLSEFNGVWFTTEVDRREGYEPSILFLDTKHMSVEVPEYLRTCGNPLPPEDDLKKVVFVRQSNGFADLWGVCLKGVAGFRAGEVVKLDHEVGELEDCANSLYEFIRDHK